MSQLYSPVRFKKDSAESGRLTETRRYTDPHLVIFGQVAADLPLRVVRVTGLPKISLDSAELTADSRCRPRGMRIGLRA